MTDLNNKNSNEVIYIENDNKGNHDILKKKLDEKLLNNKKTKSNNTESKEVESSMQDLSLRSTTPPYKKMNNHNDKNDKPHTAPVKSIRIKELSDNSIDAISNKNKKKPLLVPRPTAKSTAIAAARSKYNNTGTVAFGRSSVGESVKREKKAPPVKSLRSPSKANNTILRGDNSNDNDTTIKPISKALVAAVPKRTPQERRQLLDTKDLLPVTVLLSDRYHPEYGLKPMALIGELAKVSNIIEEFQLGEASALEVAYSIIGALFDRDHYGDGKHWSSDGSDCTLISEDDCGVSFNCKSSSTWDWKDIYAVATSKAVIKIIPAAIITNESAINNSDHNNESTLNNSNNNKVIDRVTIHVLEYSYYCSG